MDLVGILACLGVFQMGLPHVGHVMMPLLYVFELFDRFFRFFCANGVAPAPHPLSECVLRSPSFRRPVNNAIEESPFPLF